MKAFFVCLLIMFACFGLFVAGNILHLNQMLTCAVVVIAAVLGMRSMGKGR